MLEMSLSGLMSGAGKRDGASASAPALVLDSTIPQQNYAAAEIEHPEKVLSVSFVTDYQPTKVLQPGKQSLDLPTHPVFSGFVM